jgi:predicted acyl esterase
MQQRTTRGKHMANKEMANRHMTQQQREGGTPADAAAMRVDRDVKVTMRDGVRISLCVYRPQAEGRVPALFACGRARFGPLRGRIRIHGCH